MSFPAEGFLDLPNKSGPLARPPLPQSVNLSQTSSTGLPSAAVILGHTTGGGEGPLRGLQTGISGRLVFDLVSCYDS